jgi:hypothetical protein
MQATQFTGQTAYYNQRWLLDTLAGQMSDMKRAYPVLMVSPVKFKNPAHDTTYRRLNEVFSLISEIKETEWQMLTDRIRKKEESKGAQAAMF